MVRKGAVLPDRCLKCNSPAEGYQLSRQMMWFNPWWILLAFLCICLFSIVYFAVRKWGRVTVGLCPRHRRPWINVLRWLPGVAGAGSIIGTFSLVAGAPPDSTASAIASILFLVGITLLIVCLLSLIFVPKLLDVKRIDKKFIWLAGASREYLATFPDRKV